MILQIDIHSGTLKYIIFIERERVYENILSLSHFIIQYTINIRCTCTQIEVFTLLAFCMWTLKNHLPRNSVAACFRCLFKCAIGMPHGQTLCWTILARAIMRKHVLLRFGTAGGESYCKQSLQRNRMWLNWFFIEFHSIKSINP